METKDAQTSEASAPSASAGLPTSAVQWAQRWLDAVRSRDVETISILTDYPFRFDDTGAVVGCSAGSAGNRAELEVAVGCLLEDKLLDGALKANPELLYQLKPARSLPRWARRWRKELEGQQKIIFTEFGDNGITYFFVLAVSTDGVRSVFRHAEFWPN